MDPLVCLNMDHTSKIGMYVGNMFMFTMGFGGLLSDNPNETSISSPQISNKDPVFSSISL